jgi:hypothetical protein
MNRRVAGGYASGLVIYVLLFDSPSRISCINRIFCSTGPYFLSHIKPSAKDHATNFSDQEFITKEDELNVESSTGKVQE